MKTMRFIFLAFLGVFVMGPYHLAMAKFESQYELITQKVYSHDGTETSKAEGVLWTKINMEKGYAELVLTIFVKDQEPNILKYLIKRRDTENWDLEGKGGEKKAILMKSLSEFKGFKFTDAIGEGYSIIRDFTRATDKTTQFAVKHSFSNETKNISVIYQGRIVSEKDYKTRLKDAKKSSVK